jgi:hypothetical protein
VSLIWHIVKKDFRRMAWPVAFWLAFIVTTAVWFAAGAPLGPVTQRWEADAWAATAGWLTLLATIIRLLLGYIVAGAIVLEDPLIGTTGFWQTRPVSNGRLFAAKIAAVFLLGVIAPAVVLVPVWFGAGFNLGAVGTAIATTMFLHFILALAAVMIGSLAGNLRQFLFLSVAISAMYFLCSGWYPTHFLATEYTIEVRRSRNAIVQFGVIPVIAAVLISQYLGRNRIRSYLLLALALTVCLGVRLVWPWNILPLLGMEVPQRQSNMTVAAEISEDSADLTFQLNMPQRADGILVPYPQAAYLDEGAKEVRLIFRDSPYLNDALVERLALGEQLEATRWRISAFAPDRRRILSDTVRGRIVCDVALTDLHRFPPLAMHSGAVTADGSTRAYVERITTTPENQIMVIVREQEAASMWFPWYHRLFVVGAVENDEYVLVSTAVRRARVPRVAESETVGFAGMAIRYQMIAVPPADNYGASTADATLTKLRFVRQQAGTKSVSQSSVEFEARRGLSLDAIEKGAR